MKWLYGMLIVGLTPTLFGLLSKKDNPILDEKNTLKYVSPQLKSKIQVALKQPFSMLHIGDSHIQIGGISKGMIDYLNQYQQETQSTIHFPCDIFSDLHNTDYQIHTSGGNWQGSTLTNESDKTKIGLAGRNFSLSSETGKIKIRVKNNNKTIENISILHEGNEIDFHCRHATRTTIQLSTNLFKTSFMFDKKRKKTNIKIKLQNGKTMLGYGILINENETKNTYYNAGISGVKYLDFFKTQEFFEQLKWLQPTFIFLTLGTNDSYSPLIDTTIFANDLNLFLHKLKKVSPNSILIGMTAPDTYYMNQAPKHLQFINESIHTIFKQQEVLLWDWHEIMGGKNAIHTWNQFSLVSSDLLHFNQKGYELIGKSFVNSLLLLQN